MSLSTVYWLVDIISTMIEELFFFCLYRKKGERIRPGWKELLLYAGHFSGIEILTYLNTDVQLKILFSVVYFTFLAAPVYKISRPTSCVTIIFGQMAMISSELIVLLVWSIRGQATLIMVDGAGFAPLGIHFASKSVTVFFVILSKRLLNRFEQQLQTWRNLSPFLIMSVAVGILLSELHWNAAGRQTSFASPSFIIGVILFTFSFGYYVIINAQNTTLVANKKLEARRMEELEKQHVYYEEKLAEQERVRSIYHDMKNHLLILDAKSTGSEDSKEIIESLQSQMEEYENYYHTGSAFLDVIIRDKSRAAREKGVDFSAMLHFEEGSFIDPLDISTIFGNALDNAIEASIKIPQAERLITVKAMQIHEMLSIVIENNCPPDASYSGRTNKEDDFLHGFGIKNIEKAVEKYDGKCTVSSENGVFSMKIIIPIP